MGAVRRGVALVAVTLASHGIIVTFEASYECGRDGGSEMGVGGRRLLY